MKGTIQIHIEKLPEGVYLANSDDIQGLVALGRRINEAMKIDLDVAGNLPEVEKTM